jgi:Fe-S-cluster-containing dehydrogenase component/anaerobic selenocysteine-containing dehydrogenase
LLKTPDDDTMELDRRDLLRLLGASAALAGVGACTQSPREKILPYALPPREVTPGTPTPYATSMVIDGFAMGLLVQSHEGRPTKIEGNPDHPASLGATGAHHQASVLDLYDPGRPSSVRRDGGLSSWGDALHELSQPTSGRPWFVLPPQSSPLMASIIDRIRQRHPAARFSFVSPISRRRVYEATQTLFGRVLEPQYDFGRARVVLSLGADFLSGMAHSVRWSREFARARRAASPGAEMNRLYVVESTLTPTGSMADHRAAVRPSAHASLAAAILREVVARSAASGAAPLGAVPPGAAPPGTVRLPPALVEGLPPLEPSAETAFVRAAAHDLAQAGGASVVIAADAAPLELHLLAHALNAVLGNWGQSVWFSEPALLPGEARSSLADLAAAIDARAVDRVLILDSNPVYFAPPGLELERRLRAAPDSLHLTAFENETSRACRSTAPLAHYLESWGDARAFDGTISFIQPLIEPLHPSRSVLEVLAACAGDPNPRGHGLLTEHYRNVLGARFETRFDEHLRSGVIADSAAPRVSAEADFGRAVEPLRAAWAARLPSTTELHFETSPNLYDGRFANNAWLLELPHPSTKQTWGNGAVISPALAAVWGVENGRVLELEIEGTRVEAPALILPGQARDVITLALGYGQTGPHLVGAGVGVNAYLLRATDRDHARPLNVRITERSEALAITQDHGRARGRPLALLASLDEYRRHPDLTAHLRGPQPTLLPMHTERAGGPQWAMTIDTSICLGCNACVIACQAENNVPVVGKREVQRGREMHWLRIDRYFEGPDDNPRVIHQPMACQHCEMAPCEYVCPVNATVHSPDGLNEMVYNRCIGTRFCSNNCPYKVRRFNWFEFTGLPTTEQLARNPDVTVRERGVMEKCTFCVQRIRRSERQARVEQREIAPGEVVSACQQACPTEAIQFGSLTHAGTKLVDWRQEGRAYSVLHELGTRPRTQYLAKIDNPNSELSG